MPKTALAVVALCLAAGCASAKRLSVADARRADEEAVAANAAVIDSPEHAKHWIAVQNGAIAGTSALPVDAVGQAASKDPDVLHRFVFRPGERGPKSARLAYIAEGGVVAGPALLASLGLTAKASAPGRPRVIRARVGGGSLDLATTPRLVLELRTLDSSATTTVSAAYDPDFDGPLLVTDAVAEALRLERFEIPGGCDVQVAVSRPFLAHRATVIAHLEALNATAPAEVVFEGAGQRR
jgi:hypothetical protein